ncbi:hypothetical protein QE152_g5951 [Popillia japonica]|uniref:PID domain-containing protein n=1 Tax=Popillia japonica TaxID=7064 RepID=A0AAW1MNC9_POPJA
MALKLRKDIKKSSYYVWFLGAKESKGLRGPEFILPVIKHLEDREKDVEPFKVTLQVSHKGMKIIQNIVSQGPKAKPKNETIKHFIPHNTITCVYQQEDVIACILLLFNPVTKCPLHVHAYRCDSLETAGLLKQQLQLLIERPENQKKFAEIESRLLNPKEPKKFEKKFAEIESRLLNPKEPKKFDSSIGSDTGTSTRESESSEERFSNDNSRITTLYDSVAAELRAKLCKKDVPILLPPRDYDTVHRQKGNLTGIELRRCLNANIVGQNAKPGSRRIESSGGSSGIGSDHPPSPDSPDANDSRFNTMDNHSTSDEEWNQQQTDVSMYLINGQSNVTLPRPSRHPDTEKPVESKNDRFSRYQDQKVLKYDEEKQYVKGKLTKEEEKILHSKFLFTEDQHYPKQHKHLEHQKSLERSEKYYEPNPRYDSERIERYDFEERRKQVKDDLKFYDNYRTQEKKFNKYHDQDDDGFVENIKYRVKSKYEDEIDGGRSRYYDDTRYYNEENRRSYKDEDFDDRKVPVPKIRQKYSPEDRFYPDEKKSDRYVKERHHIEESKPRQKYSADDPRFYDPPTKEKDKYRSFDSKDRSIRSSCSQQEYFEDSIKRRPQSPEDVTPRDRFKDAKEKFLLLERDRLEQERKYRQEALISPNKDKHKRSDRYFDFDERDVRYYEDFEEKSRTDDDYYRDRSYTELPESERYPGLDRGADLDKHCDAKYDPKFIKNQKMKNSAGYRHSYAEPKLKMDKSGKKHFTEMLHRTNSTVKMDKSGKKHFTEMLHRTNSTVSNSGRVGIASVQPY